MARRWRGDWDRHDLESEACLAVCLAASTVDLRSASATYFVTAIRRRLISYTIGQRARKRQAVRAVIPLDQVVIADPRPSGADLTEVADWVESQLGHLSDDQADVIRAVDLDGQTLGTVAERWGCSHRAARYQRRQGLERLRRLARDS